MELHGANSNDAHELNKSECNKIMTLTDIKAELDSISEIVGENK